MSAIKYAEMRKNMRLGDYFETEKDEEDNNDGGDEEYSDYIG